MKKGFTLIELMIVVAIIAIIAAIAIPSLLSSQIAAKDTGAVSNLKALVTANTTFNTGKFGQSAYFGAGTYDGYCAQSSDLVNAYTLDDTGAQQKIKNLEQSLCSDTGLDARSNGYLFRYTVGAATIINGVSKYNSYMICAWPESPSKTGTKIYIVNEGGTVYWRNYDPAVAPPVVVWPTQAELDTNWKFTSN